MPYNPSTGIYTLPAVYLAIPGTTILAAQHNTPLEDLATANNYPRPVIAGGTDADNAADALVNLGAASLVTTNNFAATQSWARGANIASANTLILGSDGNYFLVTGTITIVGMSSKPAGTWIMLLFNDSLTLVHGSDFVLPNAANIVTQAGDVAILVADSLTAWRMATYSRNSSLVNEISLIARTVYTGSGTHTYNTATTVVRMIAQGAGGGGGSAGAGGSGVSAGCGGGGGGYQERWLSSGWSTTSGITVGAGGAGGTSGGAGSLGGSSSISTLCGADGGGGGSGDATRTTANTRGVSSGGAGGSPTGTGGTAYSASADVNIPGMDGGIGVLFGGIPAGLSGVGGNSHMGMGGTQQFEGGGGNAGRIYGGGGSGACTVSIARNGGLGANGIVIIEEYA